MDDYAVFWFRKGGSPRRYSFWAADAIYADFLVRQNRQLVVDLLDDLVANYTFDNFGLTLSGGVTNLTDEAPPFIDVGFNAKTDPPTYRMFGRGYYLRASWKF